MSVLKLMLLLLLIFKVLLVVTLLLKLAGRIRLTPPTRNRRLNLGISKGSSPKSTEVALPEVQAS